MFSGKKVIIFDMDGTLIDSIGIWTAVDHEVIDAIRTKARTQDECEPEQVGSVMRRFPDAANPYLEYCRFLKEKYHADLSAEEIYTMRYTLAHKKLKDEVFYKKDADVLVRLLKEKGLLLAIATTTGRANMEIYRLQNKNLTNKARIDDYFSLILTKDDVKAIKPDPEVYLRVMAHFGVRAEECLVFEDSLVGVESAKNAGMAVAAIYDAHADHEREAIDRLSDYQFREFGEVIRYMKETYERKEKRDGI